MKIFDTHIHIGLIHEDSIERKVIIKRAKKLSNVERFLCIANSIKDFDDVHSALKSVDGIYFAVGISPSEVSYKDKDWEEKVTERLKEERVIAVGETGLDYTKKFGNKNSQVELFISHIEIAKKHDKPLVIHNREAGLDIIEILKNRIFDGNIVFHCYSENWDFTTKILKEFDNAFVSFAGNLTYKSAKDLYDTAKKVPLERVVLESESPFMTPNVYKGKRNIPEYLMETLKYFAMIRNMEIENLADILWQNSNRLFGFKE